jgi:hypothetical protein
MKQWLRTASIPNDRALKVDLTGPTVKPTSSGTIQLEGKKEMKSRGLASPDAADATLYASNQDTYAQARNTCGNSDTSGTSATLGQRYNGKYATFRYLLKNDTSSIGAGSTVTQVNLKNPTDLAGDSTATDFDVQIVKQDWSGQDPITSDNREAAYDNCLSGTADDNIFFNTSSRSNSGNLSTTWVSKTGATYYSLRSSRDYDGTEPTGNEYIDFYAGDYTANPLRRIYLTVAYSAASTPKHYLSLLGVGK